MSAENQTILGSAVHRLCIDIVARLAVLHQPSLLLPFGKILDSLIINLRVMIRKYRVEINLRLRDMKQGFFTGHLLSLF